MTAEHEPRASSRRQGRSRQDRFAPPARLGDLLPATLDALGTGKNLWLEVNVRRAWVRAVGDEIAARTAVVRLRNGSLEVAVAGDAWRTELRYLGTEIARKLNDILGEQVVREVVAVRARSRPG